jgi:hypothetical protein
VGSDAPESKVKGAKVTEGREEHDVKRARPSRRRVRGQGHGGDAR